MKIYRDVVRVISFALIALFSLSTLELSAASFPSGVAPAGQRISAGENSTCAILDSGQVRCWGTNYGILGDGTEMDRKVPTAVIDLGEAVTSIAVGRNHACAITVSGGMKCWGGNYFGQLGNGTTVSSLTPVDVVGLSSGVVAISAGRSHTCAVTVSGLKCWGNNSSGQLGTGPSSTTLLIPEQVLFLGAVSEVSAGSSHTCAVTTASHSVKCWGNGNRGQLGNGSTSSSNFPDDVMGLFGGVSQISAGKDHTCVLLSATGALKCWGANEYGQLGDGSTTDRLEPIDVDSISAGATAIAAGWYHTCAAVSGAAKCWGLNNTGRLGTGERADSLVPVDVTGLSAGVQQMSAGGTQSCAWQGADSFTCWGNNLYGQVGNGDKGYERLPQAVLGLEAEASAVKVGSGHACAIRNGAILCWGSNRFGQLGDGTHVTRSEPAPVSGFGSAMSVLSIGGNHNCALTQLGTARCWGDNSNGQLGDGTLLERSTPVDVLGLGSGILQIATTWDHTCALTVSNGVKCWGNNEYGALGDGSTENRLSPVNVSGLASGVESISLAGQSSCAVMATGSVKCWGALSNSLGEPVVQLEPVDAPEFGTNVSSIDMYGNACLIDGTGALKCRGENFFGQLGDGTTDNSLSFVNVVGLGSSVMNVSIGGEHTCAVDGGGVALCWGYNHTGQLGYRTVGEFQAVPGAVVGLESGMASIAAGDEGTCAMSTSGSVKCWGQNLFGQLGNGASGSVLVPAQVLIHEEIYRAGFD